MPMFVVALWGCVAHGATRSTVRERFAVNDAEAADCAPFIDYEVTAENETWREETWRRAMTSNLEDCLRQARVARLPPRQPGEPPRTEDEKHQDAFAAEVAAQRAEERERQRQQEEERQRAQAAADKEWAQRKFEADAIRHRITDEDGRSVGSAIETLTMAYQFHTNEVAAMARFKGKRLFFVGPADQVSIVGEKARVLLHGDDTVAVACDVRKPWRSIDAITKDLRVLVQGTVRGMADPSVLILSPCTAYVPGAP